MSRRDKRMLIHSTCLNLVKTLILKLRVFIGDENMNQTIFYGEFDLGSGRTLAVCLIHASRAQEADGSLRADVCGMSGGWVSITWVTCLEAWDDSGETVLMTDQLCV